MTDADKSPSPRHGVARVISKSGVGSRTQAAQWIREGRVRVNGRVVRDAEFPVRQELDHVTVDGLQAPARAVVMLNKPRGLVTTTKDEQGRDTVYRCFQGAGLPWLAPVGRLDKASEGLLLLTNDSEWAARVLAPESHLPKIYHVQVSGIRVAALADSLTEGVRVSNGDFLRVKDARILRQGNRNTWLAITLDEGKNRHIRRMLEQLGAEVLRLVRVAIGPLTLGDLAKGASRRLTAEEKTAIDGAMRASVRSSK